MRPCVKTVAAGALAAAILSASVTSSSAFWRGWPAVGAGFAAGALLGAAVTTPYWGGYYGGYYGYGYRGYYANDFAYQPAVNYYPYYPPAYYRPAYYSYGCCYPRYYQPTRPVYYGYRQGYRYVNRYGW